jgi:small-conductance mechanosensitive channel
MIKKMVFLLKNIPNEYLEPFRKYWQKPLIVGSIIVALYIVPSFIPSVSNCSTYNHILIILTIIVLTWLAIQAIRMVRDIIINNSFQRCHNRLDAQRINTQVDILVKIITVASIVIGISLVLITFPQIREIGISILASAGIAGIMLGFAAQKSLGSILAGVQIAFTQPIKIGDEIVAENEVGTVEEINLTYVVICTMDKRRLIIPINYFIENTFQNWTRSSSDLLGVIYMEVDYTAPIKKIREALDLILQETSLWDKKVKILQVTDTKSRTIEIRILVSALNSSDAWNLKCYVRERLIEFLQCNHPHCLPKIRLELNK